MKKVLLGVMLSAFIMACNNEKKEEAATPDTGMAAPPEKKAGDELLPMSEADGAKASLAAFTKKDVDGMTSNYDDNAKFYWSGGDSLIGKQAIKDYYVGRTKLIDSINYSDIIVLPVKVANSQSPYHTIGKWVLVWAYAHVKYVNGKKLNFWFHNDYHYNDAGKVDVAIQYIDRAPLNEATKGIKP
jgi:hypothetical protein